MSIDLIDDWPQIRRIFAAAFSSSMHCAIASIDESGTPHVTPIGSVMLTTPGSGVFFQRFTTGLPTRIEHLDSIAILAVNSGRSFWFRSMFAGRFATPPGLRLNARVIGGPRPPTADEIARFRKRVRPFRYLRGYGLLWRDVGMARDFEVASAAPIKLGKMTRGHWADTV